MLNTEVVISAPPHIRAELTTQKIMWLVVASLVPTSLAGVVFFGWHALKIILISISSAIAMEALTDKMMGRKISINNGSAFVTGLLLALIIPPTVPLWIPAVGSIFAIALGKQVFGGLGHNLFNPALIGRAFLLASWPVLMTTWKWPVNSLTWAGTKADAITGATVLGILKGGTLSEGIKPSYLQMFIGNISGSLGETSVLALLIGATILLVFKIIDWRIPATFLGTVIGIAILMGQDPLFHLMAGGVILGAFFMATDYVTTPVTPNGRLIFGLGCGLLTMLIRKYGGFPEGVCYSILLMNVVTPLLDRWTIPKRFGEVRKVG